MKAQWKRITAQIADFKQEDRVTVPVGPLLWANEEIERLRADAERYQWLRTAAVRLSLPHETVSMLVKDQTELDNASRKTNEQI